MSYSYNIPSQRHIQFLKDQYVGKQVEVTILDPYRPIINKVGVVQFVDDIGQLHGTWGGLAADPTEDDIKIIG